MVQEQLRAFDIRDERVLDAMGSVPRELFVPKELRYKAYGDHALPIGYGQTISQPRMVALMLEALALDGSERVLEVGAGSGYQAALLGKLAKEVVALELIPELAQRAKERCQSLGLDHVDVLCADGSLGCPERAPFDAIIVAAGAPVVPAPLLEQMSPSGRLVIPVGRGDVQELLRIRRAGDGVSEERLGGCRFVPLLGELGHKANG